MLYLSSLFIIAAAATAQASAPLKAVNPANVIPATPNLPSSNLTASLPGTTVANITECPALTPRSAVPTSVTDIRPDDIKVYMAIGDSITAGCFEEGWDGLKTVDENRSRSWSTGGAAGTSTIANFMSQYNSKMSGASTGDNLLEICYGILCPAAVFPPYQKSWGYNMALSGATASDLSLEVSNLVKQVKADGIVDVANDWKFLTILIGANDMCLACSNLMSPDTYEATVRASIEALRAAFPRMIVHISTMFKVSEVYGITKQVPYCATLRNLGGFVECPCAFTGKDTWLGGYWRSKMDQAADAWNERIMSIAASYVGKYNDFAVIADPGTGGTSISDFGVDYISQVDCFHPSALAHAMLARGSWNNLFHTLATKATSYVISDTVPLYCPTDSDRIQVA
ncbi:hypothetical protein HKX48_004953 [Thoreauomyces humboldtii]|nr:hypothetical protein HKX48_004953 [Thoreauomyces humboldtii]